MSQVTVVTAPSKFAFDNTFNAFAARGFQVLRDEGNRITLSKRKPFNWPLAILCLFIPIIGWIALVFILLASGRRTEVVEIVLDDAAAARASAQPPAAPSP